MHVHSHECKHWGKREDKPVGVIALGEAERSYICRFPSWIIDSSASTTSQSFTQLYQPLKTNFSLRPRTPAAPAKFGKPTRSQIFLFVWTTSQRSKLCHRSRKSRLEPAVYIQRLETAPGFPGATRCQVWLCSILSRSTEITSWVREEWGNLLYCDRAAPEMVFIWLQGFESCSTTSLDGFRIFTHED